jgi:cytochrome c biogenesis protein CcdA
MGELLLGTTLLASFLGGLVALLAPCCISVMLPAYFATGFRNHGGVVPATLVFGGGVATVILPIGLGATALSRLLIEQHTVVFLIGGVLMLLGGVAMLLGMFSGVASACCAPVLAGVAVLSGAAASFPAALGIGLAYVAGMVAPLSVIALLWDRHQDRLAPLLTGRVVRLRLGSWRRRLPLGNALSGLLLIAMGGLAGVLHQYRDAHRGVADPGERMAAARQQRGRGCAVLATGLGVGRRAGPRTCVPAPASPAPADRAALHHVIHYYPSRGGRA